MPAQRNGTTWPDRMRVRPQITWLTFSIAGLRDWKAELQWMN